MIRKRNILVPFVGLIIGQYTGLEWAYLLIIIKFSVYYAQHILMGEGQPGHHYADGEYGAGLYTEMGWY